MKGTGFIVVLILSLILFAPVVFGCFVLLMAIGGVAGEVAIPLALVLAVGGIAGYGIKVFFIDK